MNDQYKELFIKSNFHGRCINDFKFGLRTSLYPILDKAVLSVTTSAEHDTTRRICRVEKRSHLRHVKILVRIYLASGHVHLQNTWFKADKSNLPQIIK